MKKPAEHLDNFEKSLSEIREDLILNNKITFEDSIHRTNFCKKLINFIKKIHLVLNKTAKDSAYEERFFVVAKYLLKRGAKYLKQEHLNLLNNLLRAVVNSSNSLLKNMKSITRVSGNPSFCFYMNFQNLVLEWIFIYGSCSEAALMRGSLMKVFLLYYVKFSQFYLSRGAYFIRYFTFHVLF